MDGKDVCGADDAADETNVLLLCRNVDVKHIVFVLNVFACWFFFLFSILLLYYPAENVTKYLSKALTTAVHIQLSIRANIEKKRSLKKNVKQILKKEK